MMGGEQILVSSLKPVREDFGRSVTASDLVTLSINLTNRTPSK